MSLQLSDPQLLNNKLQLQTVISSFFQEVQTRLVGFTSLSITDAWSIFNTAISQLVLTTETYLRDVLGPEKKALVLAYLDKFYDEVILPIDIPYIPAFIEVYLDGFVKKLFLALASGAIDALVATLNKTGVFK